MSKIHISDLKNFCREALCRAGMDAGEAAMAADVLTETDAYGLHTHGSKNLSGYLHKAAVGGLDLHGKFEIVAEGPAFAVADAHDALGMVTSCKAMQLACDKAAQSGIAIVTVRHSCHFGAASYYVNMAAKRGMIGLAMSNVDPNMTIPGAKGMVLGNDPVAYAAPSVSQPSVFLDIALSNVASLKVVQARKDGRQIPSTWIVDKDGLPTTDPSHYPEEGAMQPMAAHKGYGLAIMVELLTGILSGGCTSMGGDIVSWCFELDKPNNVCHTFIAIDPTKFLGAEKVSDRVEDMAGILRAAPKAKGATRIYTPGEIEWTKHHVVDEEGFTIPADVEASLQQLAELSGIALPVEA